MKTVASAVFLDRHGFWAKEECAVDVVRLTFEDASTTDLTLAEFQSLSQTDQEAIRNADASVRVNL